MVSSKRTVNETTLVWNDLNLSVVFGRFSDAPYHASDHSHVQYEMFIFGSCSGNMTIAGNTFFLTPNTAIIIPPGVKHSLEISTEKSLVGMTIRFSYKKISGASYERTDKLFALFNERMSFDGDYMILKDKYFGNFCRDIYDECESNPLIASVLIKHLFEGLFIKVLRCINEGSSEESFPLFSYTSTAFSNDVIISIKLEDYMSEPGCTLTSLAKKLDMSTRNVQRIIKNRYGTSFSSRLSAMRISRSLELMHNESLSLFEIAQKSGYNRYDSFRKAFIAKMGISPTEYREQCSEKTNNI